MEERRLERYASLSGLVVAVLLLIRTLALSPKPPGHGSLTEFTAFYADKAHILGLQVFITGIVVIFGTVFFGGLRAYLVRRGADRLANIMFAGWIIQAALALIRHSFLAVPVLFVPLRDPGFVEFLGTVAGIMLGFVWMAAFLIAASTSIATSVTNALPKWFGWATAIAAVVFLLGGLVVSATGGFFSLSGNYRWVVLYTYIGWTAVASLVLFDRLGSEER
jgi:hypothetical protein